MRIRSEYEIIKSGPGLHNCLCSFHAFQYSIVTASKDDAGSLTLQQKGLEWGIPQT